MNKDLFNEVKEDEYFSVSNAFCLKEKTNVYIEGIIIVFSFFLIPSLPLSLIHVLNYCIDVESMFVFNLLFSSSFFLYSRNITYHKNF